MRSDIQFLRGIAVLFVVIYHSGLGVLPHGYLGVDLFFVLSGFLITKLVLSRLEENSFSFVDFYYRRARRLLPALYCTLFFTTFLSFFLLTKSQMEDYQNQFLGALTFSSNMVLPSQTGYFESDAEGKPLLHIWSLSLEEQYYFLLPLFLFVLPSKLRILGLTVAATISLFWCFSWILSSEQSAPFLWRFGDASKYEWAFYLLPTRAWELLAGSIAAWVYLNKKPKNIPLTLKNIAIFTILSLGFTNITPAHPDIEAMLIVLATSLLLLADDDWLPKNSIVRAVERIGDWSYSVYLVHWPLFAFAFLSFVGKVPNYVSISIMAFSIILGYLQFKFVESPFRYKGASKFFSNWKPITAITSLLLLISVGLSSHPLYGDYGDKVDEIRKVNHGLSKECENSFTSDLLLKDECKTSRLLDTVVWGDSYAMHLVPGLIKQNSNIAQITKSVCGPFLGIAPVNRTYNETWAKNCIDYNNVALRYILDNVDVKYVIMGSPLTQYFSSGFDILSNNGLERASLDILVQSYRQTVSELRKAGKQVVFVSPPPRDGRNLGECLERKYGPALMFKSDCSILIKDYLEDQATVLRALERFSDLATVYYLSELLCEEDLCSSEINNKFVYRDDGHLSIEGSIELLGAVKVTDLFNQ